MKKFVTLLTTLIGSFLPFVMCACSGGELYLPSREITVVLLNGNHYTVSGENKQTSVKGGTVTFDIEVERGYKVVGFFGDECEVSKDVSFKQTVTFSGVRYNMTAQLKTEELTFSEFKIAYYGNMGEISFSSELGEVEKDAYYDWDIINLSAVPKSGYRFVCWSTGGYFDRGGTIYQDEPNIGNVDITSFNILYANFEEIKYTRKTLIYKMDDGTEIEQDCLAQYEHHYRANTLTAVDLREKGVDCDSRYLAGWQTEAGEYVGLGCRTAIAGEEAELKPVWKEYTSAGGFSVDNGKITGYAGSADGGEVVIPNEIGGQTVTTIGANAFENCSANIYYLPDTVISVEDNAFLNCKNLTALYISDNIVDIRDEAFTGCINFETLYVNAYTKPKMIKEQVSVASDVYDRLALNSGNGVRKVVVLGGSGTQSAYNCSVIAEMFAADAESVEVYNFGWSAAYCGLAQFEVINSYLSEGDIFLHAPEHYAGVMCANTGISPITGERAIALTNGVPYIYRLAESNWQMISNLKVNHFSNLFAMLSVFNKSRANYRDCEYSDYCTDICVEGYGYRPDNEQVFRENGEDKSFAGPSDILSFASNFEVLKKYMYEKLPSGVMAYVTFPAMNKANLMLTYGNEAGAELAVNEYTARVKNILAGSGVQVLLTQGDTVYDGRYFYNHDYHLGHPTRDTHTEKVFTALIENFKLTGG